MSNANEYGYDKMSVQELNHVIADLVKKNEELQEQKKEFVSATNEVIKENKRRISMALATRGVAEQTQDDTAHEQRVSTFLAQKSS